jgi:3-phenylpropionate/trans-cinnamate dioxygenase ferredoxin subunit
MSTWKTVGTVESFNQTPRQFIDVHNLHIAVVKINQDFYSFESMCTHAMFELDDAPIEGDTITCPLHGAKFCLKSGAVLAPPAYEDLLIFPVRIENGEVQIET